MDILEFFTDNKLELQFSINFHDDTREVIATLFDHGAEVQMLYASDSLEHRAAINGVEAKWTMDFPLRTTPEVAWSKLFSHIIADIANHRNALLTNTFSTNGVKRTRDLCLCVHKQQFSEPSYSSNFTW